ncbi:MAG: glycosyl hydrolase [Bacteroidota bacterium]
MKKIFIPLFSLLIVFSLSAQKRKKVTSDSDTKTPLEKLDVSGLKFRSVGPALTSGRISDFAVNTQNPKGYYVAVSSGGVWKTTNWGTTYKPVFDTYGSYSIGCVTIDPNHSSTVWVGTGENNNQRSVAYGDGIYKSVDGGKKWKNMGLKSSEHIGKIIVHPDNSDVIYVAAIGPLWSSGGDRGVYQSTDGGETWTNTLSIDEHTGVNDIVMHPENPNILYASAYQRRRHVFTYLGGGPESTIYKTEDGGKTWNKANEGLPKVDIGRIGLAFAPSNPNTLYAIVEAAQNKGGLYRSTDQGASWQKRGKYNTSGNYYQEIIVDPNNENVIYAMDTWMHRSEDGGKTFTKVGEDFKHVDNHCLWINPNDSEHLLAGCDGGIYETWDRGKTWNYKPNLPVTQFYKVAVDNREPFYHIYGGTQDNFSLGGPSRTNSGQGIVNSQWYVTHGGDGFESQIDPENPDIVYAQSQYGVLVRYDHRSGEEKGIQPKERKDEPAYRWNWDAPLAVSTHKPSRLYFAANKVLRSQDRGNSWEVISDDLTQQIDRNKLPVMGRIWGIDAVAKNRSTSPYGTIVALSESPINENLIVIGTDDGLIQITEDGGSNWRKTSSFPGVPGRTYVNAVLASEHDENVIYACFNHHKYGDFKPYVYKSSDKGRSWVNISNNLPDRGSSYAIAEDFESSGLLFVGTEFGVFFSNNGGSEWKQLKSGVPTIAVRDLAIQKRETDLILGTFGRGFYVLDDYSTLREVDNSLTKKEADLFAVRDALLFEYDYPLALPGKSFQGNSYYTGENLGSEAVFTYFLKDKLMSLEKSRQKLEADNKKDGKGNPFPSYDNLKKEREELAPYLLFTITDSDGNVVRKLQSKGDRAGIQRIHWDLRYPSKNAITLKKPAFYNPFAGKDEGSLVPPGTYSVRLSKVINGKVIDLDGPESFQVEPLDDFAIPPSDREAVVAFQTEVNELSRAIQGAQKSISEMENQLKHIAKAIERTQVNQQDLLTDMKKVHNAINDLKLRLNGDPVATQLDIQKPPTPASRIGWISYEQGNSTTDPTETHKMSLAIAQEEFKPILADIKKLVNGDLKDLQQKLEEAGAPYTPYTLPDYSEN